MSIQILSMQSWLFKLLKTLLTLNFGHLAVKGLDVENGQFLNEHKKILNQLPSYDFFYFKLQLFVLTAKNNFPLDPHTL